MDWNHQDFLSGHNVYQITTGLQIIGAKETLVVQMKNPAYSRKHVFLDQVFVSNITPLCIEVFHDAQVHCAGTSIAPCPMHKHVTLSSCVSVQTIITTGTSVLSAVVLKTIDAPAQSSANVIEDDLIVLPAGNVDSHFYLRMTNTTDVGNAVLLELCWLEEESGHC